MFLSVLGALLVPVVIISSLITIVATITYVVLTIRSLSLRAALWNIPGPSSNLLLGNLLDVKSDRSDYLADVSQMYGQGICKVWAGPFCPLVIVTDPAVVKEVLVTKATSFTIPDRTDRELITRNAISRTKMSDARWKPHRDVVAAALSADAVPAYGASIVDRCDQVATMWEGRKLAWADMELRGAFQDLLTSLCLGEDSDVLHGVHSAMGQAVTHLEPAVGAQVRDLPPTRRAWYQRLWWLLSVHDGAGVNLGRHLWSKSPLGSGWRSVSKRMRAMVRKLLVRGVRERWRRLDTRQAARRRDVLQCLVEARMPAWEGKGKAEEGKGKAESKGEGEGKGEGKSKGGEWKKTTPMRLVSIVDEAMSLVVEGRDSSAALATWALRDLAGDAHTLQKVLAEIDEVVGGELPSLEHLSSLPYLNAALTESLRLHPPTAEMLRITTEPVTLAAGTAAAAAAGGSSEEGLVLPAGVTLLVSPLLVHTHPANYENPRVYDPTRFLPSTDGANDAEEEEGEWQAVSAADATAAAAATATTTTDAAAAAAAEWRAPSRGVPAPGAFIPFSMGPRVCPGRHLATASVKLLLVCLLQRVIVSRYVPRRRSMKQQQQQGTEGKGEGEGEGKKAGEGEQVLTSPHGALRVPLHGTDLRVHKRQDSKRPAAATPTAATATAAPAAATAAAAAGPEEDAVESKAE